jgi:DNA-binding CsgD family transcriptional regulator
MNAITPILMVSYEMTSSLSPRQQSVLQAAARGYTARRTALMLDISPHTVKAHLRTAMARLDAHSVAHAVAIAVARGMVSLNDSPLLNGGVAS